jgi:RHS repeat-associated protein
MTTRPSSFNVSSSLTRPVLVTARARFLLLVVLGVLLAPLTAQAQPEVIEYYALDHLGSVRVVFDASGNVVARADYAPFGETTGIVGTLPPVQFTGQARDGEAGMDYFGARFYQPRHGRFSTVDPVYAGLFDPQSWNRYTYVRNSPLALVDPDGRTVNPALCTPDIKQRNANDYHCQALAGGPAQAFLNGPDNMAGFAAESSAQLQGQAPPGNAGQHEKGERKVPLVNETTGEVQWLTEEELHRQLLVVIEAASVFSAPTVVKTTLKPKIIGPSKGYELYGEGRVGGIMFWGGSLVIHLDVHPFSRGGGPSVPHFNVVIARKYNFHLPVNPLSWWRQR